VILRERGRIHSIVEDVRGTITDGHVFWKIYIYTWSFNWRNEIGKITESEKSTTFFLVQYSLVQKDYFFLVYMFVKICYIN
jgi:hypothetical protein